MPASALADTSAWLARPDQWKNNKGDPGFSDPRLADLQFASALLTAIETGHMTNKHALKAAVGLVRQHQAQDGSWPVEPANPVGSPGTYGTAQATFVGWQLTKDPRAAAWLRRLTPDNVPAAAALLLVTNSQPAIDFLLRAQASDGGWGPYAASPAETFDTALALLALKARVTVHLEAIQRGRKFLFAQQRADGSWPATTRPSGGESYAQTVSTTAWATLALLATQP